MCCYAKATQNPQPLFLNKLLLDSSIDLWRYFLTVAPRTPSPLYSGSDGLAFRRAAPFYGGTP